ncbi:hypothetical protein [Streptomyces syringium]|uniref:hypothetical protein n=1 Tax=Streptomyces syringium TaxID=76729 RepID=UPI003403BC52
MSAISRAVRLVHLLDAVDLPGARADDATGVPLPPKLSATAGAGPAYEGLHGIDGRARLAELPQVHAVCHLAVLDLLQAL